MRKVTVNASLTYDVLIDKGNLDLTGKLCAKVVSPCRAAILTDSNVAPIYAERVERSLASAGFSPIRFVIDAGEQSKSADSYLAFVTFLAQNRVTRSDCIIALGGGVVGDLAGFCAATYLRGIRFVQIPTTLLAMVDSSVGGKTAIDIPEGKNLVGAFYQPSLVICDIEVLSTLPENIFADGCAEVIKYGIIGDRVLFDKLKKPMGDQIEDIIESCVRNKRDIVNLDECDTGMRQLLNLGHTPAHSIETLSHFTISHGSAVAMGMALMARASLAMGFLQKDECDEITSLIERYSLPTKCPYNASELASIALTDKKRAGGQISLIIPYSIGDSRICKTSVDELEHIFALGQGVDA
ncbi:MAG: 3-dehydroquinate synthase [Ruminococcaceae bacterium]|nr:3-dehydroquinate synthase [Oscillospiraceae bacterium]